MYYFNNCTTINEAKATYRELAKKFHPDIADYDTTAIMQQINTEYAFAVTKLAKGENLTAEQVEAEILNAEQYKNALNAIINLHGITVELCGGWLWVSGNTYPLRKELNAAGFQWANTKKMWFFRSPDYAVQNRKVKSIEEIRVKYGSQVLASSKSYSLR